MLNHKLVHTLARMASADQKMRKRAIKTGFLKTDIDRRNIDKLQTILNHYGWPTITLVGKRANSHAWLLAMHADLSPILQKECLRLMEISYKKNPADINPMEITYLRERIQYNKKHLWKLL
jgi:hypothetical protein